MQDKTTASPTKSLFVTLKSLYVQAQQLLLDSDRLMDEQGWQSVNTYAPQGFSYLLNAPERWFARWAVRFYEPPSVSGDDLVKELKFVSVHFASDQDTEVEDPLLVAGMHVFQSAMPRERARESYEYWLCKSWFWDWGKTERTVGTWHQWNPSKPVPAANCVKSFAVPLYEIKSSKELKELVIDKLFAE
ncbi:MAG: hypothetical protein Q7T26_00125 [Dehalococcoidia bacterium]|nr:hypothetical protein [Dehalococcoidia bacterium]